MNTRAIRVARRTARRVRNHMSPRAVILLYHRIATHETDPWSLSVSPKHFAEHMAMLGTVANPVPLQALVDGLRDGRVPRRAVAVTFDDGYAGALHAAKPILDKFAIPATMFLPSGLIGAYTEFWWDELERILLEPGELPACLRLEVNGVPKLWELGTAANYRVHDAVAYRSWRAWDDPPTMRHAVYQSLYRLLQRASGAEQLRVLADLRSNSDIDSTARTSHRVMTWAEAIALFQDGLVELGAHSVSHPVLASLDRSDQRKEIQHGKAMLEQQLGKSITSFAYPYGRPDDQTAETADRGPPCGIRLCVCQRGWHGHPIQRPISATATFRSRLGRRSLQPLA